MKQPSNEKVQAQIFIGYHLTPEFRIQLDKSGTWKQAVIAWQSEENGICEIQYDGKQYLGVFVKQITVAELRKKAKKLEETILLHCPEINPNLLHSRIFPQLFIS